MSPLVRAYIFLYNTGLAYYVSKSQLQAWRLNFFRATLALLLFWSEALRQMSKSCPSQKQWLWVTVWTAECLVVAQGCILSPKSTWGTLAGRAVLLGSGELLWSFLSESDRNQMNCSLAGGQTSHYSKHLMYYNVCISILTWFSCIL